MKKIKNIFISMRPEQWPKNLIIFAAIFFGQKINQPYIFLKAFIASVIYCILSSALYILNDIFDIDSDRYHAQKSKRPLASGKLGIKNAFFAFSVLTIIALVWSFFITLEFFVITLVFLALHISYDIFLKHITILDVFAISFSFVLRLMAGASAVSLEPKPSISSWILLCTILLSLFLALCKRRSEISQLAERSRHHRRSLFGYSQMYLDQLITIVAGCTILSYSLYTLSQDTLAKHGTDSLKFTIPFIIYGIFRYLYLVNLREEVGLNPERILLRDKPFIINFLLYIASVYYILYKK